MMIDRGVKFVLPLGIAHLTTLVYITRTVIQQSNGLGTDPTGRHPDVALVHLADLLAKPLMALPQVHHEAWGFYTALLLNSMIWGTAVWLGIEFLRAAFARARRRT